MKRGEFLPSGRIPSENELSREYRVSVMTVRKALSELVHQDKILRIQGKGSFVNLSGSSASNQSDSSAADAKNRVNFSTSKGIVPLVIFSGDWADDSFGSFLKGAQGVLSGQGYSMTIEYSHDDLKTEAEILDRCLNDRVAGMLIFSTNPQANAGKFAAMEEAGIPVVLLDRWQDSFPCSMVTSYHFDGLYQVTRYLIGLGHRNIVYLANDIPTSVHAERLAGFKSALLREGQRVREELCITAPNTQVDVLGKLIPKHGVTAVACIRDRLALEALEYLRGRGSRIPQDISVTGFDDTHQGRYAGLTSVHQDFMHIGELGAKKLLDRINHKTGYSRSIIPVELVIRGSSGPAKDGSRDNTEER
jgi:DNA-binding LacI/PurR family transcriptional regulator